MKKGLFAAVLALAFASAGCEREECVWKDADKDGNDDVKTCTYDADGDGKPERTTIIFYSEYGKPLIESHYHKDRGTVHINYDSEGNPITRTYDFDNDRNPDAVKVYKPDGTLKAVIKDLDDDGHPDVLDEYDSEGNLKRKINIS